MTYHCVNFPVGEDDDIILASVVRIPHRDAKFTYTQADFTVTDTYKTETLLTRTPEVAAAIMNDVFSSRDVML